MQWRDFSIKHKWIRRCLRVAAVLAVAVVGGGLLVCWHFGVWSWRDWEIYEQMSKECHPVWRDLHAGRIYSGQPLNQVIEFSKPSRIETFENVTMLTFIKDHSNGLCFTGVRITARDGVLVRGGAGSCTWDRTFFDDWPASEQGPFWHRYSEALSARLKARDDE